MAHVCVALSGGVDSAVTAHLLQKQGHTVIGAFIKVWQPDFLPCSQEEDRISAKRVAASLGIPFFVVDLADVYKREIVEYMVRSYESGETPNPDVLCNKVIKFGALWEWAQAHGCTHIATGHHARVEVREGRARLLTGVDDAKDQSYFVWQLPQKILDKTFMPIGAYQKKEVRAIAASLGLDVSAKKDSQGLCFLGAISMADFLNHFIPEKEGPVLDETGRVIGAHRGAAFYTRGERHGFTVHTSHEPQYITAISIRDNSITVSPNKAQSSAHSISLRDVYTRVPINPERLYHVQVRYHGEYSEARIRVGEKAHVEFESPIIVAPGQSCVFFDGDECIGGGIVAA